MAYNPAVGISDGPNLDAFGRLRSSNPQSLHDFQCQYDTEPLRLETGHTGTGVAPAFDSTTRLLTLQVNSGGSGGTSWVQSFDYVPYEPGKSQLIFITGILDSPVAGAVARFGSGDAANGIFLESNGTSGPQFSLLSSVSGSPVATTVAQNVWNLDVLDGTGKSGLTLDLTKAFILVIDFQALGRVRVGFEIGGQMIYAHQFLNANVLAAPWAQMLSLPIKAEIVAASALGANAKAYFKGGAVLSEGGLKLDVGRSFSAQASLTAASGARTQALSLQPLATFAGLATRGRFALKDVEVLVTGANPVLWELCVGVVFTGSPVFTAVNSSYSFMAASSGLTYSSLSGGVLIYSGYVPASNQTKGIVTEDLVISYPITLDRSGAVRSLGTLTLLLTGVGGSSAANVALNWREIR